MSGELNPVAFVAAWCESNCVKLNDAELRFAEGVALSAFNTARQMLAVPERCGLVTADGARCFTGCCQPVSGADLYRCLDCNLAFHRDCLRKHCASSDEKDAEILRLRASAAALSQAGEPGREERPVAWGIKGKRGIVETSHIDRASVEYIALRWRTIEPESGPWTVVPLCEAASSGATREGA